TEVADFFLRRFLGCRLLEASDVNTKRFFTATEEFINEKVTDPVRKARYNIALLAELNRTTTTVRPRDFAQQNFEVDDRQSYIEFLRTKDVPTTTVQKDTTLIAGQLRRLQVDFSSGLAVLGPPDSFREHVKMSQLDDGRTRVEIEDRVKRVHGKR
ncbi:MAG: nucleoid-associated protein, partial [Chloroflexi bacterium]|nr:nucleoid-associated protein [Chloroflexota bacterium]